jgi:demethylmenaquinone methyltransferase/2-methoxy-6-polyprenyl-1,4-benzoquinol methylase
VKIFGRSREQIDKHPATIAEMFTEVAPRYDLMNDLASMGQDRRWRYHTTSALSPQTGDLILDLAAGTGASSRPIAQAGAHVIATDLTEEMVRVGKKRHPDQDFVVGDGLHLPYADACFDAATMSFGLRNVHDINAVLTELARVVRPGGTLVICEFSRPTSPITRLAYRWWLKTGIPLISSLASSHTSAYTYLGESILDWHDQRTLAAYLEKAGWTQIQWRNLTGGIVALHRAVRP